MSTGFSISPRANSGLSVGGALRQPEHIKSAKPSSLPNFMTPPTGQVYTIPHSRRPLMANLGFFVKARSNGLTASDFVGAMATALSGHGHTNPKRKRGKFPRLRFG